MMAMPGQTNEVDRLQERLIDGLRLWDTGTALPNFLGCETQPHQVRAAYRAADYEKLTAIKRHTTRTTCSGSTTTSRRRHDGSVPGSAAGCGL
jgi:hypothetical protein